jgi:glycosyltransferase involved in cell wall biosynthesis
MKIITHSKTTDDSISKDIGKAEYSYYFIWKKYLPAMENIGEVIQVNNPETEVDPIYEECRANKEPCVFLSFTRPDETCSNLRCPTICVFAWEYSNLPNEQLGNDLGNDWVQALGNVGRALTLSSYATDVTKASIDQKFSIVTIPAPICRRANFEGQRPAPADAKSRNFDIQVTGTVIDSLDYDITVERAVPRLPKRDAQTGTVNSAAASNAEQTYNFGKDNPDATQMLVGFYGMEDWGAWSRTAAPWVILPTPVCGEVKVQLELIGHGENVGGEIEVLCGTQSQTISPGESLQGFTLNFQLDEPVNYIKFGSLKVNRVSGVREPRTLAIGLSKLSLSYSVEAETVNTHSPGDTSTASAELSRIQGKGVVYTSVLNPADGRKQWEEMVTAFCWAFRDRDDAVLILKMTNQDISSFLGLLLQRLAQLAPFQCRVIAIHGYLEGDQYDKLVEATDFVVNSSTCEGQCLPLMEFMAKGIPAIAPDHTAMADYIDRKNALVLESYARPSFWPNDPRRCYRTDSREISWESLKRAFEESYVLAMEDPTRYADMGKHAQETMLDHFSVEAITPRLEDFLRQSSKKRFFSLGRR